MTCYMLDTNIVSHLLKGHAVVAQRVAAVPMPSLCISAVTAGELHFGLAKRPDARRLHTAVTELFRRVDTLPWDSVVAETYGHLRTSLASRGRVLGALDMMIAAHALHGRAVLVSNDRAFSQIQGLPVEDWTVPV